LTLAVALGLGPESCGLEFNEAPSLELLKRKLRENPLTARSPPVPFKENGGTED